MKRQLKFPWPVMRKAMDSLAAKTLTLARAAVPGVRAARLWGLE